MKTKNNKPSLVDLKQHGFLFNKPLLMDKDYLDLIQANNFMVESQQAFTPMEIQSNHLRIGVIPIHGCITNRFSWWGCNIEMLQDQVFEYATSPNIDFIVFDINSPGGEAFGIFEFAEFVSNVQEIKPIYGFVNHYCASAAYAIGAACTELIAIPSAYTGSVGVYMMHTDISKMLDNVGINITLISAGKYKVDGNPFEVLSNDAKDRLQQLTDFVYNKFINLVANNRGKTASDVENNFGQGRCLTSSEAIKVGMIDKIEEQHTFFTSLIEQANKIKNTKINMSNQLKMLDVLSLNI